MKSAGKARNNGLYRHIRTSKEIIRNLLNDLRNNNIIYYYLIGIHMLKQRRIVRFSNHSINSCNTTIKRRIRQIALHFFCFYGNHLTLLLHPLIIRMIIVLYTILVLLYIQKYVIFLCLFHYTYRSVHFIIPKNLIASSIAFSFSSGHRGCLASSAFALL